MSRNDLPSEKATNHMARVRETLQTMLGFRGDKLDRVLTLRDVVDSGLLEVRPGAPIGSGAVPLLPGQNLPQPVVYVPDLTPPPSPGSLTATGAISHVLVEVPPATYLQGHGHLRTHLYGANPTALNPTPVFADAVELGQFDGTVWALASNPSTTWHLWAKWESKDNVLSASPTGGTNGVVVTTGQNVATLVAALTGPGNPFKVVATETTLPDGSVVQPGTYTADAYIHNGQIVNAKIADLAVDNAKISDLSVSKLTAGSIAVGQYAQSTGYVAGTSGWRINGDGAAEFSGVVVRGTVYANAGLIGGITVENNAVRAGQTAYNTGQGFHLGSDGRFSLGNSAGNRLTWDGSSLNVVGGGTFSGALSAATGTFVGNVSAGQFTTGAFTGYAWPPAGAGNIGTYLGPSGLLIGNANNGEYFQVQADGDIFAPGFNVQGGVMTVTQADVIGTLNLQGQAVTIPVAAYTAAATADIGAGVTSVQSASIASSGAPIVISGGFEFTTSASATGAVCFLYRGETELCRTKDYCATGTGGGSNLTYLDQPGVGTHTYSVRATASGGLIKASQRAIVLLETKR